MNAVTPEQKKAIDSVLSLFETGKLPTPASYATCTILRDGAGISYGKHQATDRAGSLDRIVREYVDEGGAHAAALQPYLARLSNNETAAVDPANPPAWVTTLVSLLKTAGADPVMQRVQDQVFDEDYWNPCVNTCQQLGLKTALSHLIVYDTCIHSGPGGVVKIRNLFPDPAPSRGGDERAWARAYVNARYGWLAGNPNPVVQKTVYRQAALLELINNGNWDLTTPFRCRGVDVTLGR